MPMFLHQLRTNIAFYWFIAVHSRFSDLIGESYPLIELSYLRFYHHNLGFFSLLVLDNNYFPQRYKSWKKESRNQMHLTGILHFYSTRKHVCCKEQVVLATSVFGLVTKSQSEKYCQPNFQKLTFFRLFDSVFAKLIV